jgi:CheY-like chemotaxis protein
MVDGDRSVLALARHSLSAQSWCELVTVADGLDAAEYLKKQKFDGLITADRLPRLDGFELIERLKASPQNAGIPIVMLTVEGDIDTMRRGFKAGVTFFAPKPATRERFFHLFSAVRGAMESERRRHLRLPYRTQVTCLLGDQRFVAESVDISEGGMSLEPTGGAEVGAVLELEFLLPSVPGQAQAGTGQTDKPTPGARMPAPMKPQKVRARVLYVSPSDNTLGVTFLELAPAHREVIQQFVAGDS